MATFFMFGKYSSEALKGISDERTKNAVSAIEKCGGKVKSMYALLGEYDLVLIVELPGTKEAVKASLGLNKLTGISFSTSPAITVEDFDKMVVDI